LSASTRPVHPGSSEPRPDTHPSRARDPRREPARATHHVNHRPRSLPPGPSTGDPAGSPVAVQRNDHPGSVARLGVRSAPIKRKPVAFRQAQQPAPPPPPSTSSLRRAARFAGSGARALTSNPHILWLSSKKPRNLVATPTHPHRPPTDHPRTTATDRKAQARRTRKGTRSVNSRRRGEQPLHRPPTGSPPPAMELFSVSPQAPDPRRSHHGKRWESPRGGVRRAALRCRPSTARRLGERAGARRRG